MLRLLESDYNDLVKLTYERYVEGLQSNWKHNPSSFWSFIRAQRSSKRTPYNVKYNDNTASSAKEAANLFAEYFQTVFKPTSSADNLSTFRHAIPAFDLNIPNTELTVREVLEVLNSLDASKGPGIDGLPPSVVKSCANELCVPITIIFNRSLTDGTFPTVWKTAKIVPIHKAGSINNVENYRGISILCCLGKVFETIVHRFLYNAAKPFISEFQHGFVERRSTTTNLMVYANTLFPAVEARGQVDSIYVDFSKAFDVVPHTRVIIKLQKMGFPDWIVEWLESYLTGRRAFVQVDHETSSSFVITSGVPQGSVLGPLIFILFLNDLEYRLTSGKLFFADDLKIYRIIASMLDCTALQGDIDRLLDWCDENGMNVNIKKCNVISFTRCHTVVQFPYKIGSLTLNRVDSIRDLGVTMDSKLRFNEHVAKTAAKGFSVLGFIRRHASLITDVYALKSIYCCLVRSLLEYAAPVWAPYQAGLTNKLERIQKYFIRFALRQLPWTNQAQLPPYTARCQLIDLETLSSRRLKLQRVFIFDILTNRVDCPELLRAINLNVLSYTLRTSLRTYDDLVLPTFRTNYGFNNPFSVCIRAFNHVFNLFEFDVSKNVFVTRIRNLD